MVRKLLALLLTLAPPAAAGAAVLDLPIQRAGAAVGSPSYAGDVLELRLSPAAARAAHPRAAGPTSARSALRLGVASVDAVSALLGGCIFEPEFVGETTPDDPSETDFTAFWLVHLPAGATLEEALDRFAGAADVLVALPIATVPMTAVPNDSLIGSTTWLYQFDGRGHDIMAPEAWDVEDGDTSIVVAIIDTGVLPYHPDLGGTGPGYGNLWVNWTEAAGLPGVDDDGNGFIDDWQGWDFVSKSFTNAAAGEDRLDADNDPNDFAGHGTAVAGIVGAIVDNAIGMPGVAPKVRLMPLRIAWQPAGFSQPVADVSMTYAAQAIRYATRMGAKVINASFASVDSAGSGFGAAVTAATRAGVAIANASGNNFSPAYLGQRDDVISVAATDSDDVVQTFSVFGPWVDLSAQGIGVTSTFVNRAAGTDSVASYRVPGYRAGLGGTSFAAPQVAGTMALLQAQRLAQGRDPLTPQGLLARLRETADDIRAINPGRVNYGVGRLNAYRALTDRPTTSSVRTLAQTVGAPVVLHMSTGVTLVVYAMSNQQLVAFDGTTGDTVWVAPLSAPAAGQIAASPARFPGGPRILVPTTTGQVLSFYKSGEEGQSGVSGLGTSLATGIAIGDLNGNGYADVVVAGVNGRVWAYESWNTPLANFPFDPGTPGGTAVALADLDSVAGEEIIFWSGDGSLHALRFDGNEAPGWPWVTGAAGRAPVVARFAGPGAAPTVLTVSGTTLTALAGDGSVRWSQSLAAGATSDPALGDLDGDGLDEIVILTGTSIAVLDSNGFALPAHAPQGLPSAPGGAPLVGPFLAGGGAGIGARLSSGYYTWDGNGAVVYGFPKPGVAGSFAALADLDGDGATEIAAGTALADSNVYAFDAGAGTWTDSLAYWPAVRGDDARTGARSYPVGLSIYDVIPPADITDAVATALSSTVVRVTWTNTGDDGLVGRAKDLYFIGAHWIGYPNPGFIWFKVPNPDSSGVRDTLELAADPGETMLISIYAVDESGNASMSCCSDTAQTPGLPPTGPNAITDLVIAAAQDSTVKLRWTAPADVGYPGQPVYYEIAGAPYVFDSTGFAAAPVQRVLVATAWVGHPESLTVTGLERGRRWSFAVRGVGSDSLRASLSNLASVDLPKDSTFQSRGRVFVAARPVPGSPPITLDWEGAADAIGSPQHLDLLDLTGRLIQRVQLGGGPGGSWQWDGRDGDGRAVPAGLYFARLASGGSRAEARVVLIR